MQCTDVYTSDKQLSVMSGVRQGCILSPIFFNMALDYITRQITQSAQHEIQSTVFSQLESLDYADDIVLVFTTGNYMQQNAQLGLKLGLMNVRENPQIQIDVEELEVVTHFTYLGSNISVEISVHKYISAIIHKSRNSYCSMYTA